MVCWRTKGTEDSLQEFSAGFVFIKVPEMLRMLLLENAPENVFYVRIRVFGEDDRVADVAWEVYASGAFSAE